MKTMSEEIICPHCKKPTYDSDALLCHFCGESLQRATKGFLSQIRYGNNRVWWYFLGFVVAAAVALLFIR